MFDAADCVFLYLETCGRVGSGEETKEVDLPVQREVATGYPLWPSSVVLSDALPLLFPVRSLAGLFAWVTSAEVCARFQRDLATYGVKVTKWPQPPALPPEAAGVAPGTPLLTAKQTL